jgi:hypothetical protein
MRFSFLGARAHKNEKGRVERSIRYIRDNFFAARTFSSVEDLNAQALTWCLGQADARLCPQDKTLTVGRAFAQEKPSLLALPVNPYTVEERLEVKVGKTPVSGWAWHIDMTRRFADHRDHGEFDNDDGRCGD